ncbi:ShlB/FhaC/HecB family hemolysin secretion/activation protein [Sphingomonas sp. MMS24-J13]|uniref:ShlB/FhaC/HecB family hemolysin secretion/activation protein n=1 Tax=Sphingomonas sp. MMS24-J13 TaxID=3238686 RepID=UPI00384E76BC
MSCSAGALSRLHWLGLAGTVMMAAPLDAQSIERNLPPAPVLTPSAPPVAPIGASDSDKTPLGPPVRALVLLGASDPLVRGAAEGVDLSRLVDAPAAKLRARLAAQLGQPLSRALLSDLRKTIVLAYRAHGHPFLTVVAPPQPIDAGVLQMRVVVFHLGRKTVSPADAAHADRVARSVRVQPGEMLSAPQIAEDLAWLNRNPYRKVESTLSPGSDPGTTDLTLQVAPSKPWSFYAGYANSGTPQTGRSRFFAGFQAALPGLPDGAISYQTTVSGDAITKPGDPFSDASHPLYISHAARMSLSPAPRQAFEFAADYVHTNVTVEDFLVRQWTLETSALYRSAASNLVPGAVGSVAFGVEFKRQYLRTLFGDFEAFRASQDVIQLRASYNFEATGPRDNLSLELAVKVSPGGLDGRNDDRSLTDFAFGVPHHARYAFVTGQAGLVHQLGHGWVLQSDMFGQFAPRTLPLTEAIGIGGPSQVRAYTLDDGSFDQGVVSRTTLRLSPGLIRMARRLSPYLLADAGYGAAHGEASAVASAFGAGADYRCGFMIFNGEVAVAATNAGRTRAGSSRFNLRITSLF